MLRQENSNPRKDTVTELNNLSWPNCPPTFNVRSIHHKKNLYSSNKKNKAE